MIITAKTLQKYTRGEYDFEITQGELEVLLGWHADNISKEVFFCLAETTLMLNSTLHITSYLGGSKSYITAKKGVTVFYVNHHEIRKVRGDRPWRVSAHRNFKTLGQAMEYARENPKETRRSMHSVLSRRVAGIQRDMDLLLESAPPCLESQFEGVQDALARLHRAVVDLDILQKRRAERLAVSLGSLPVGCVFKVHGESEDYEGVVAGREFEGKVPIWVTDTSRYPWDKAGWRLSGGSGPDRIVHVDTLPTLIQPEACVPKIHGEEVAVGTLEVDTLFFVAEMVSRIAGPAFHDRIPIWGCMGEGEWAAGDIEPDRIVQPLPLSFTSQHS